MAIAGDEVAAMFGDKDRPKGGNAMLQYALFSLVGKASGLLWVFYFASGLIKKSFKKAGNWLLKKLEKTTPIYCRKTVRHPIYISKYHKR